MMFLRGTAIGRIGEMGCVKLRPDVGRARDRIFCAQVGRTRLADVGDSGRALYVRAPGKG
jgi:hypothetical protein